MNSTSNIATMTIEELQKRCVQLEHENAELIAKLNWFMEQFRFRLSKKRQFGASSERSAPETEQLSLFNEAEVEAKPDRTEPDLETITYKRRKQRGHREAVLENLPVETVEYRLPAEEQVCSCCGGPLHEMSTEEITTPIVTALMPSPVLPGSLVSPSVMAYIMNQKYGEGLPLYRFKNFQYNFAFKFR